MVSVTLGIFLTLTKYLIASFILLSQLVSALHVVGS